MAQFPWNAGAFADFKGALYASSDWYDGGPTQVWRSFDGMTWEPVVTDGFNSGNINTGGFGRQGGYLYIGTGNFDGGEIWRTKDGVHWEMIAQKGLDDPDNGGFVFVSYRNLLYTFSYNEVSGCKAYISKDGINWMPANEPGWGDPANIAVFRDGAWVIFKGKLYASPLGPLGIINQSRP